MTLTLFTAASRLDLPVRPPRERRRQRCRLRAARARAAAPPPTLRRDRFVRTIELDLASNETVYTFQSGEFEAALVARIEPIEMDLGYHV